MFSQGKHLQKYVVYCTRFPSDYSESIFFSIIVKCSMLTPHMALQARKGQQSELIDPSGEEE
jgi:hypothetical protein